MKQVFAIAMGAALGWATGHWDAEAQLALERQQRKLERAHLYQTTAQEVEAKTAAKSIFYVWP